MQEQEENNIYIMNEETHSKYMWKGEGYESSSKEITKIICKRNGNICRD